MASLFSLPNEVLLANVAAQFPGRAVQARHLATLFSLRSASCRALVVHGLEATGKSAITRALLEGLCESSSVQHRRSSNGASQAGLLYAIIDSRECITGRHLLEQVIGAVAKAVGYTGNIRRCENITQLVVELRKLIEWWCSPDPELAQMRSFVLVFDGIDRQREAPPTLLPALARLGELIPCLTAVFIVTLPRPHFLHMNGVPYIHFPIYSKSEAVQIVSNTSPTPELPTGPEDTKAFWNRFCSAVWDSLSKHAGRDILSFRTICLRLWPSFVAPVLDGTYGPKDFGRVLVFKRSLFQDERILVPSIVPRTDANLIYKQQGVGTQLPYFSRLVLVASYLSSFNRPVTDHIHFMKGAVSRRRKKGGGTALSRDHNGVAKSRKISRKLLGPQAFVLERMLAIFQTIKQDADDRGRVGGWRRNRPLGLAGDADIQSAIATLASLRLLVKQGGANSADTLDGGSKWRVAVGWDFVRAIARSIGVEVEDYLAE
ncbi:origin recognition complex subunit Orc5-like protein [Coleophoma cylindrospora]|uniref:Origin recognition complex subunit Orc5-like protein n=1 Tax=Coleophoma cylindrospora TaxID=1849047 RepID=A0A3D8SQI7_9HELO|nr:origin recognition complex subunit Orc5-like protein [Coleophoma cylindrospora]